MADGRTNIEIGQYNVPLNAWVLDDTVFSVKSFLFSFPLKMCCTNPQCYINVIV